MLCVRIQLRTAATAIGGTANRLIDARYNTDSKCTPTTTSTTPDLPPATVIHLDATRSAQAAGATLGAMTVLEDGLPSAR